MGKNGTHSQSFLFFSTDCANMRSEGEALGFLRWFMSECFLLCILLPSEVPCLFATHGVFLAIGFLRHWGCSTTGHFTVHLRNFQKNRERAAGHCAQKL